MNKYLIIPLGGLGTRFKTMNYLLPKPLVNVLGKPIINYLLDNINTTKIDYVIIPYNNELNKYNFEDRLRKTYPEIKFIFYQLDRNTDGAAETLLYSLNKLNIDEGSILSVDGDNFYLSDIITAWNNENKVFTFEDNGNEAIYSYSKIDDKNNIIEIQEKNKISRYANTGAYGFSDIKKMKQYCKYIIENNIRMKNEYYISTVINEMIKKNINFKIEIIRNNNYICLGTPLHARIFCNNYPKYNSYNNNEMIKKQRFCFDLDGTLVTFPKIKNDYRSVEGINKNIEFVRYLKKMGHTIIIQTARNMMTQNGNIGKVLANVGKITFETLEKLNIPYDEIYFGKPQADFYIDDLGISAYEDLEKETGYYRNNIDPREFNNINLSSIELYKKSSINSLEGEINYYKMINNELVEIKDMFPIMFNYDEKNYKYFNIEKIDGIPISKLYLKNELSITQLDNIINSILRIHNIKIKDENNINIYGLYVKKIEERYKKYNYSKYKESDKIYNEIKEKLKEYEELELGKKGIIHGDPVFTNILINQFGKIKFIDMRGKIENEITVLGDKIYDWAKLYQSLKGYDEILEDIIINNTYKNTLINHFEKRFMEEYKEEKYLKYLKIITKSLLFSLIPLHDYNNNNKCNKYYELIFNI
jgi:capsule biosynthesis phosphatase